MQKNAMRLGVLALMVWTVPALAESPADKYRKALEQEVSVDFQELSLQGAVDILRSKTKLNIMLDQSAGYNPTDPNLAIFVGGAAAGGIPVPVGASTTGTITMKRTNVKLRTVLKSLGTHYNVACVYIAEDDAVLIAPKDQAYQRQMQQVVSVDLDKVPLETALKKIAADTAVNLVLDQRQAKKFTEPVSLELNDVPLETAVRLLSELAGVRSVRVANVLFVTSRETANEMLQQEAARMGQPGAGSPYGPLRQYGIRDGISNTIIINENGGIPILPPKSTAPGPR